LVKTLSIVAFKNYFKAMDPASGKIVTTTLQQVNFGNKKFILNLLRDPVNTFRDMRAWQAWSYPNIRY